MELFISENLKKIQNILNKHNIKVELKGYKEMQAMEGYHMSGNLYVNGKRALHFEDYGNGGGVEYKQNEIDGKKILLPYTILNYKNAKPLLDIENEFKQISLPIDNLFYELASELLTLKELKKKSKKNHLFVNKKGEYFEYPKRYSLIKSLENFKNKNKNYKNYYYFDEKTTKFKNIDKFYQTMKKNQQKRIANEIG